MFSDWKFLPVAVLLLMSGRGSEETFAPETDHPDRLRTAQKDAPPRSDVRDSWLSLAVFPEVWIGKNVLVSGWLDFDMVEGGGIGDDLYIFETVEAMEFRLEDRAVVVRKSSLLQANHARSASGEALLLALRGKHVRVSGTFDYCFEVCCIGTLTNPQNLSVDLKQDLTAIPGEK